MSLDLSTLQYKDVRYLLAVYRMGSFRDAAMICNVTQATISGQVSKIERMFNLTLIERSARRLVFTEAGKLVVESFNRINDEFKVLSELGFLEQNKLNETPDAQHRPLFRIGVVPTLSYFFRTKVLNRLAEKFPDTNFEIIDLTTPAIITELEYSNIDFAIATTHPSLRTNKISSYSIGHDDLVIMAHEDDVIEFNDNLLDLEKLGDRTFFVLSEGHCLRDQALAVCKEIIPEHHDNQHGLDLRFGASSLDALKYLSHHQFGVSVIPRMSLLEGFPEFTAYHEIPSNPTREVIFVFDEASRNKEFFSEIAKELKTVYTKEYKRICKAECIANVKVNKNLRKRKKKCLTDC